MMKTDPFDLFSFIGLQYDKSVSNDVLNKIFIVFLGGAG